MVDLTGQRDYDPRQLAAYLRKVRGEGIQPSFTNKPAAAGPNDFLLNENVWPDNSARTTTEIPPATKILKEAKPEAELKTPEDVQSEILNISQAYQNAIHSQKLEIDAKYGVPQAEKAFTMVMQLGAKPGDASYDYALEKLNRARALSDTELSYNDKGQLVGKRAEEFRPLDQYIERLKLKAQQTETAQQKGQLSTEVAIQKGIDADTQKVLQTSLGVDVTKPETLASLSPQAIQAARRYKDTGEVASDIVSAALQGGQVLQMYNTTQKQKLTPENQAILDQWTRELAQVREDIKAQVMAEAAKGKQIDPEKEYSRLLMNNIQAKKLELEDRLLLTVDKLALKPDQPGWTAKELDAANYIYKALKESEANSLKDLTNSAFYGPEDNGNITKIGATYRREAEDFYGVPFTAVWNKMLEIARQRANEQAQAIGSGLSISSDNPRITNLKLQGLFTLWGLMP